MGGRSTLLALLIWAMVVVAALHPQVTKGDEGVSVLCVLCDTACYCYLAVDTLESCCSNCCNGGP
ncbi:unnamed protein product [Urochloa humidicola]